ncbi:MAG: hypothetical protein B7Z37_27325 [Verrucomicrobia bacterium 12-59-8]|nr:MAG: hypothetical protein B7Z37_27325 [Verrucomicrobia bacterium 12-59-8]
MKIKYIIYLVLAVSSIASFAGNCFDNVGQNDPGQAGGPCGQGSGGVACSYWTTSYTRAEGGKDSGQTTMQQGQVVATTTGTSATCSATGCNVNPQQINQQRNINVNLAAGDTCPKSGGNNNNQ